MKKMNRKEMEKEMKNMIRKQVDNMIPANFKTSGAKAGNMISNVFGKMQLVYPIDGRVLRRYRKALGISRKKFANLCHWSEEYQRSLEETLLNSRCVSCLHRDRICAIIVTLCQDKEN